MTISIFLSSAKGGPQDTTNEFCKISEIDLNCFKRSKNCWKPFLWSKQCLSTHKNWVWQFQFFFVKFKGDTSTIFFKISEIAFNCFKRSKNCWKPFLWSKQCLSARKTGYDNFNFFFGKCKGGTTGYHQRILQDFRNCLKPLQTFSKLLKTISLIKTMSFDS